MGRQNIKAQEALYARLRATDTEALRQELWRALAENCEEELVEAILAVLEERDPVPPHPGARTAYERFRQTVRKRYGVELPPSARF